MPRSDSGRRVLIMDDVSWSEAPRRRRGAETEDLAPASWVAQDDWRMERDLPGSDVVGPEDEWATSPRRSRSVGRATATDRAVSAGRPVRAGRPSVAGQAMLDQPDVAVAQAGGLRVVAEFDWADADVRSIEDRIWGTTHAELPAADPAPPSRQGRPEADRDDESVWGPRPRLIADEPGGRRTVVITGRVADRYAAPRHGRDDSLPAHHRWAHMGAADRMAMWAVGLGLILVLVAILSAH